MASTLPEQPEFHTEEVNSPEYLDRHGALMFEKGFSFSGFERDKVWIRDGDHYLDVSGISGADDDNDGRALLVADFDDDGDDDLFVHDTQRARHHLYRNDAPDVTSNRSISVRLRATAGHPQAAGGVVRVTNGGRVVAKLLSFGSGFLSQNSDELVFGISTAPSAEVSVEWPGRATESFGVVAAGKYQLVEGTGKARDVARHPFRFLDPARPGLRVRVGETLPPLPLLSLDGTTASVELSASKNLRILNFWALWCNNCLAELKALQRLQDAGKVDVLLIGVDPNRDQGRASDLLRELKIDLPCLFLTPEAAQILLDPTKLPLPTSLILSSDGQITEILQGSIESWSNYQSASGR